MTVPNINDVIEITMEGEFDSTEDVQNVFQMICGSTTIATQAEWQTDLNTIVNALLNIMKGYASIITWWRSYRVRNLTQGTPTEQYYLSPAVQGILTGDSLASGVCALWVFRTNIPGVTLRKFLGPPTENVNDAGGKWSSSFLATGAADLATMMAGFTAAKSQWWYGHYHVPTASPAFPTSAFMPSEPAYQRRRRRGRGS